MAAKGRRWRPEIAKGARGPHLGTMVRWLTRPPSRRTPPRRLSSGARWWVGTSSSTGLARARWGRCTPPTIPSWIRRIALKALHASSGGDGPSFDPQTLAREARAMARLSHPNVVAVHDVVEKDDWISSRWSWWRARACARGSRAPRTEREILDVFAQADGASPPRTPRGLSTGTSSPTRPHGGGWSRARGGLRPGPALSTRRGAGRDLGGPRGSMHDPPGEASASIAQRRCRELRATWHPSSSEGSRAEREPTSSRSA